MIDETARPRRHPGLHLDRRADGDVVSTSEGLPVLRLNETAAALWQVCDGRTTVGEIAAAVQTLVGRTDVAEDVYRALDELVGMGALLLSDEERTLR